MRLLEVLLVERSDDGEPMGPVLLVGDRLIRGEPHPNGLLFLVPVADEGEVRLEDLRVSDGEHRGIDLTRPASVADLVDALIAEGVLTEELATAHWSALTAEERSAMPPNIRRYVTDWEPIPVEVESPEVPTAEGER